MKASQSKSWPKAWRTWAYALRVFPLAVWLVTSAAHAQTCREESSSSSSSSSGSSSQFFVNCDMQYKNTELMCDKNTVYPSCPTEPMPMKETALKSPIEDYSPYLYAYARDPDDKTRPYTGQYYRGTPGSAAQVFGMFGTPAKGTTRRATCIPQISFPSEAGSVAEEAKMVRLELDNCTNQYILNTAIYPQTKENSTLLSMEDPNNPAARIGLATHCQPLKTVKDVKNEYFPTAYIKAAWIKLLKDPTYRLNDKAALEPHLPDGITIKNPIDPPSPFPDVRLSMIGDLEYEEINDPSHPFSPRWDFEFNERDHYSPLTQAYSNDAQNSVFCAGNKTSNIIKVDILSFREAALDFDDKITDRIDFNKNCKANSGMQKNPCCKVNLLKTHCTLRPCAECYGMTAAAPVCATDYVTKPDRKKVRSKYLPVHPLLRIANLARSLSPASLTNLNSLTGGVLSVANASQLLNSATSIMNTLGIDNPLSSVMPMLNGQLNMLSNLPANLSPTAIGQMLAGQTNLLNMLPGDLPFNQVQGLLNGQVSVLEGLASNVPLVQSLGGVRGVQSLLGGMPSAYTMGRARILMNQQLSVARRYVNNGLSVADTVANTALQIQQISNMPADMALGEALKQGLDNKGLVDLPSNLPISEVRTILNAQNFALSPLLGGSGGGSGGSGGAVSMSNFVDMLDVQNRALSAIGDEIGVGKVTSMLNSAQSTITDISGGINAVASGNLSQLTSVLGSQVQSLTNLPTNLISSQINSVLGSTQGLISGLGGSMGLSSIQSALTGQLGSLSSLAGNLPIGNVSGLLSSQAGALTSLLGSTPLGSVAGVLDIGTLGGITSLGTNAIPVGPNAKNQLPYALVKVTFPYQRRAKCNPNELGGNNSRSMESLCQELRAPFTPINKLKMRYHNPSDQATITLKNGVPEGFSFRDYFKDSNAQLPSHMPYPRLWDTGRSIQKNDSDIQDPLDTSGQYTSIVGVGHEASPGTPQAPTENDRAAKAETITKQDQRCLIGGWGRSPSMGGVSITVPDPISSWTELKLYQARTTRDYNIVCLARYEKLFKVGSAENVLLSALGAEYAVGFLSRCNADGSNCNIRSLAEDKEANATTNSDDKVITQLRNLPSPLQWRGYLSSTVSSQQFPNFSGSASTITNLDKAELGDFVLLPTGGAASGSKPGLPKLGIVTEVHLSDCSTTNYCYVKVMEPDNGKWPDICGTTDSWGELKSRYLFKPGTLPKAAEEEYDRIDIASDCVDPHLSYCELKDWNSTKLYRVREDRRSVPEEETTSTGATP